MSLTTLPGPPASFEHAELEETPQPSSWLHHIFSKQMMLCCVLATVVYLSVPRTFADPDIWWHLRDAQILVNTHHFIRHDLFSYTAAGAPWMNHEWLAELPF